jgi:DNA-binding transcriptional LysR family regulator
LDRARRFLTEVRDLKSIATQDQPAGELRLGVIQTVLSGVLPGVLRILANRYPQIAVSIARETAGELYTKVIDGKLEHVPPGLNRGIPGNGLMGESIGIDSLWGAGRCRGPILRTCVNG